MIQFDNSTATFDNTTTAFESRERIDECIEAARGGSIEAFGALIETCRGYLLSIANRELSADLQRKLGASDLVQDTVCEAQQCFHQFSGVRREEFLAWVRTILLHNLSNTRRAFRDVSKREIARETSLEEGGSRLKRNLVARELPPADATLAREQIHLVQLAIRGLPSPFCDVIYLRHREHRSFAEIGERLGRTADAARKLWQRAVERLAEELNLADDTL
jgi:RNA polymerase sigma-70 factor (ECF subfamily)